MPPGPLGEFLALARDVADLPAVVARLPGGGAEYAIMLY